VLGRVVGNFAERLDRVFDVRELRSGEDPGVVDEDVE